MIFQRLFVIIALYTRTAFCGLRPCYFLRFLIEWIRPWSKSEAERPPGSLGNPVNLTLCTNMTAEPNDPPRLALPGLHARLRACR